VARSRKESVDQIYSANSRRVLLYPDDPAAPSEALVHERSLELLYFRLTSPEKTAHAWHAVMELQEPLLRDTRFVPIATAAEGVAYNGGQAAPRAVEGQARDHRGIYSTRG
jgi:hypothetical protein